MSGPVLSKVALNAQKALIRSCAAAGVGIEGLDQMEQFRLVPPPETERDREALSSYAKPSRRPALSIRCRNRDCVCHRSKWFKHSPLALDLADYHIPMRGDDVDLTHARADYQEGRPEALREWLAATADERRAAWADIDAARAKPQTGAVKQYRREMSAEQFRQIEERLEVTPQTLAPLIGVGWRTCYRYECGDTPVPASVAKLMRLLDAAKGGSEALASAVEGLTAGTL